MNTNSDLWYPESLFPTDNDLEVPTLRLDVQPNGVEIPFVLFGEQARTFDMEGNGVLHFYTDDYRFTSIFSNPQKVLKARPRNIVEPNYSLFTETPMAFGLQMIYKKRYFSRLMQEQGIGVFVDLNVASKYYKVNLLGVPAGYRSFCTRGYADRVVNLEFEYNLAKSIAGDNELLFVIYGGGFECRRFAQKHNCIYVTPLVSIKKKVNTLKGLEKIKESVMFVEQGDTSKLLESTIQKVLTSQVENYTEKVIEQ